MFLSLDHFLLQFMSNDDAHSTYSLVEDLSGELIDVLLLISNWLTVAVAVERYLAICYPLYHYTFAPAALDVPSNDCSTSDCKSNISRSTRLTVPFTVSGSLAREVGQHASREEKAIIINLTCLIAAFFLCQFPFIFLSVAFKLYESDVDSGAFRSSNLTFLHNTQEKPYHPCRMYVFATKKESGLLTWPRSQALPEKAKIANQVPVV
ncbi:hypothetical protein TSMEX_001640 [Taenia solium]|eukprot:TsM_000921200 transcript=TsM_000921200 gene=TsM_000921200